MNENVILRFGFYLYIQLLYPQIWTSGYLLNDGQFYIQSSRGNAHKLAESLYHSCRLLLHRKP